MAGNLEISVKLDPRLEKIADNLRKFRRSGPKKIIPVMIAHVLKHVIKHDSSAFNRGSLVAAAAIMGIDLRKYMNNTERIPDLKSFLDKAAMSEGLKKLTYMVGNRFKIEISPHNAEKLRNDILSDKRFEEIDKILRTMLEGGKNGTNK